MFHEIENKFINEVNLEHTLPGIENLKVKYLGQNGEITALLKKIKDIAPEEKKSYGLQVNNLKDKIHEMIIQKKSQIKLTHLNNKIANEYIDVTLPPRQEVKYGIHPISLVISQIVNIFSDMGFTCYQEGPCIEDDFHNFSALNIPPHHPARGMQDSFYMNMDTVDNYKDQLLLRTHTSTTQIRYLENNNVPCKILVPGRVYRSDSDMTHTPMFHQVELLMIDKKVTMIDLKSCLTEFIHRFFENDDIPIRFRNSFFPFTEPSAEVDIGFDKVDGEIKLGGNSNWLEVLGCGMVHKNVLKNVNIDPNIYCGFAAGMGVERLAMLKYNIPDLRNFFAGDIRWLNHYNTNTNSRK